MLISICQSWISVRPYISHRRRSIGMSPWADALQRGRDSLGRCMGHDSMVSRRVMLAPKISPFHRKSPLASAGAVLLPCAALTSCSQQFGYRVFQSEDLNRAARPIMLPAHHEVALLLPGHVSLELGTVQLKCDGALFVAVGLGISAYGFAVGIPSYPEVLHEHTEFLVDL